ncbi:merlin-like isoform X2 [Halichondria panicea]|uniref:merlin-like isoform X2 n=1 Tax=Halichondria panicea TaxID=6063 RepID=UPI00312B7CBB
MDFSTLKRSKKTLDVQVTTLDAVLEFQIDAKSTGKNLFDLVTRTIGVREVWYFGLRYKDSKGFTSWLKFNKKVIDQNVNKARTAEFHFRCKFFPEDVGEELVQEVTQHMFYLQVKASVLNEEVYCSPEASVLLASYAVQAEFGEYDQDIYQAGFLSNEQLLPQRVMDQYHMTQDMWEERIVSWWAQHRGMLREEAELEYLKVGQELEMYGVNYFEIKNKKGTQLWMGVDAFGLNIYEQDDQLSPKISFPWGEITNVEYHGKKFFIMPSDRRSPSFIFYVSKTKISDHIMQLCMGNHDLYMRRRRLDTMEVQQMKAQAKEERARKMAERDRLERETQGRIEAERRQAELEERLVEMEEEARRAHEDRLQAQRIVELLSEKVKLAEEEAQAHARKKMEAEEEIRRVRASAVKSEEEKLAMERKVQLAEQAATILHSSLHHDYEREEPSRGSGGGGLNGEEEGLSPSSVGGPIITDTTTSTSTTSAPTPSGASVDVLTVRSPSPEQQWANDATGGWGESPRAELDLVADRDIEDLTKQLEKESMDYQEKYKYISEQLTVLKTEMDDLKNDDRVTRNDVIHESNFKRGRQSKRRMLDQSKAGTSKTRIAFYEEL